MQRLLATAAQLGFAIILLASLSLAHGEEDAFSKWAAAHAVSIATVEPGEDFSDLLPLKSVVGTARLVALGEPIHGAHEPMAFRNRLIRFLVEQLGFTAVVLEMNVMESASVASFVGGGPGDAQSVIAAVSALTSVPYAENVELIQWMRDYNTAPAAAGHHRIRFYGIDLPFGGRVGGARRSIDFALAYLSLADAADANRIRVSVGDKLPPSDDTNWGPVSQSALATLDGTIPVIAKAMARNRSRLIARSSVEEYRWALHNLEVAQQLAKCFHVTTPKSFTDMRYAGPVMACRDRAMAENVQWAVENEGPKGRVMVFGHDGHIMNGPMEGGRWSKMPEKPLMMGSHLRRAYGKDLVIIAMIGATATAGLPTLKPVEDDIDGALARVGLPRMFVDLRMARRDPAAFAWLSRPHFFRSESNGLITPATAVDAFFFVNTLTPAIVSSDKAR